MPRAGKGKGKTKPKTTTKRRRPAGNKARKKTTTKRRQPVKTRPKKSRPGAGQSWTVQQREDMFIFWCRANRNITATAKHFGITRETVYKIRDADKWLDRFNEVIDKIRAKSDHKVVRGITETLQRAQVILDNVGANLEKQGAKINSDVHSFVKLAKYIDEASGDIPATPGKDVIIHVVERVINGSEADRRHIAGNFLADLGVYDKPTVDRLSKIFPGKIHSQN
jgi:hypothetical protein